MRVTKIVVHAAVEQLTREGWQLDRILDRHSICVAQLATPLVIPGHGSNQYGPGSSGYIDTNHKREESHVVSDPLFVLTKDLDVLDRETALSGDLEKARKDLAADKAALTQLHGSYDNVLRNNTDLTASVASGIERERDLRGRITRLEEDIGKLRVAIGNDRMREILGR